MEANRPLTETPRFWAAALVPVAGLVAWYLIFGLDSYSSIGILAPIGVAVVASFLANAIWPVCRPWKRALFYGLPASCVYTIALIRGIPHLYMALEAFGGLLIYFLVVGALVGFSGFLGSVLSGRRQTKVISPPADAAIAAPTEAPQDGASTSTPAVVQYAELAGADGDTASAEVATPDDPDVWG